MKKPKMSVKTDNKSDKLPVKAKNDSTLDLKQKELFYEKILSGVSASVIVFDLFRLKPIWTNNSLRKTLGIKRNQKLTSEEIIDLYHPDDQDFLLEMRNFFRENKNGTFNAFYKFRNSKGEYMWFFTSAKLFRYHKKSNVFEVLGVTFDFSSQLNYGRNLKLFAQEKLQSLNPKNVNRITKREKQIIKYFSNGFKTREIAELLGISFYTVSNHRKNVLKKFELKNLAALVNFAVENGLD